MIEIIRQTEKTKEPAENRLPKNIRQIGNPEKDFRIYMEDYVYTYLHPAQIHAICPRLMVLLGEINHFSNRSCAFISGAIQVENSIEGIPELNDPTWRKIHKEIQRFFDKCEIVGWVLDIPGNTLEVTWEMEEIHRNNFINPYQFFFLMDSMEREEAFYTWKNGCLTRKEGYFIYYEKNPAMQEYMISRREAEYGEASPTEGQKDQAARNYRAMMMGKKEHSCKNKTGMLSHLISLLTVIILCSVSVILIGNIRRMEDMEQTISVMSNAIEPTEQEIRQVAIETVSSNIVPIDKNEALPEGDAREETAPQQEPKAAALPETEQAPLEEDAPVKTDQPETENAPLELEEPAVPALSEAEICLARGYYIVQPGDSLRKICYKIYQTYIKMEELCSINAIDDQDIIFIGQKLLLP